MMLEQFPNTASDVPRIFPQFARAGAPRDRMPTSTQCRRASHSVSKYFSELRISSGFNRLNRLWNLRVRRQPARQSARLGERHLMVEWRSHERLTHSDAEGFAVPRCNS